MAEFQEVIKQGQRMCDFYIDNDEDCKNCPIERYIDENDLNVPCGAMYREKPEEYEAIVMQWAKAHPEPVYPTWGEWFNKTFPKGNIGCFSPCAFYDDCDSCKRCGGCNDFYYDTPIPAYIAEKLGIKPKEAGK